VLQSLADKGNTVIVIEHNLDVIKNADWVIDMGPEGGSGGGNVVAQGTPEAVAAVPESHTGTYLAEILEEHASAGEVPAVPAANGAAKRKPAAKKATKTKAKAGATA
jgi:excinuclease ABC subunit A